MSTPHCPSNTPPHITACLSTSQVMSMATTLQALDDQNVGQSQITEFSHSLSYMINTAPSFPENLLIPRLKPITWGAGGIAALHLNIQQL